MRKRGRCCAGSRTANLSWVGTSKSSMSSAGKAGWDSNTAGFLESRGRPGWIFIHGPRTGRDVPEAFAARDARASSAAARGPGFHQPKLVPAAIRRQIAEQLIHVLEGRPIDQVAAVALLGDETRMHEVLQMKGQGRGRDLQGFGDGAGRQAGLARDDEKAEHPKAKRLGQRGQGSNDFDLIHIK